MPRDKNIFTLNPTNLDMQRSVFDRNSQHKTSFNLGEIVPIYFDEILPGDTVTMDLANVIRMGTPIAPIMDNMFCDVFAFFVPNRLTVPHWEEINGENKNAPWAQNIEYTVPEIDVGVYEGSSGSVPNDYVIQPDSLGFYLGLPISDPDYIIDGGPEAIHYLAVVETPGQAYFKIFNDWFRNENVSNPARWEDYYYASKLLKANRFHDYFSSGLPAPQKGASVELPLGSLAPVIADSSFLHDMTEGGKTVPLLGSRNTSISAGSTRSIGISNPGEASSKDGKLSFTSSLGSDYSSDSYDVVSSNLFADLSNATAATVNQVRLAFQLQKLLEKDARGGTRYIEVIRSHWGVTSPDARLQRSEYLAGHRFRINVDQVVATADSGSSGSSIVGQTGAVSKTAGASSLFTKSFTEHGVLMVVAVVRQDHTYSQGIEKYWHKTKRFDFFWPVLSNIGEVGIKSEELFAYGQMVEDSDGLGGEHYEQHLDEVFAYQEYAADYRYKPSRVSGYLNPVVKGSLNYWTLADLYTERPGLNEDFLLEQPDFLDRALAVQSSTMHQFVADFYFKCKYSRVMPLYSIPGLIDHH